MFIDLNLNVPLSTALLQKEIVAVPKICPIEKASVIELAEATTQAPGDGYSTGSLNAYRELAARHFVEEALVSSKLNSVCDLRQLMESLIT